MAPDGDGHDGQAPEDMEYTTLPKALAHLEHRFAKLEH